MTCNLSIRSYLAAFALSMSLIPQPAAQLPWMNTASAPRRAPSCCSTR